MDICHNILYFLNNYAGKKHNQNDINETTYGQLAYESAKLLGLRFESKINGFKFIGSTKWQNSGNIKNYFWLQFKRAKHIDSPFSISISNVNIGGKYHFKVYLEIADKEYEKASNKLQLRQMFWHSIIDVEQPNCEFYYEGVNPNPYYPTRYIHERLGSQFESATLNLAKFYKITTNISVIVEDGETDASIIERLTDAFNELIPGYDAIFDEAPKPVMPKKDNWIIPCDYKQYDIIRAFAKHKELDWHVTQQTKSIKSGDRVYIYVGKPFSRIMYECEVVKTGLSSREIDDLEFIRIPKDAWDGESFRIRLIRKLDGLLSLEELNDNGLSGNVMGARKLSEETVTYIEKNAKTSIIFKELNHEEINQLTSMSETELEAALEAKDESAGYIYKETISKVRKINQKIIDDLKMRYKGECQLCGARVGCDFGEEIVEAHHIEYFSQTQNNDSTNIIVLCPNCHRLIHRCNPVCHKKELCYEFENGKKIFLKNPGHLK